MATTDLLDLTRFEADLAIRISRNPGDTLTGVRLLKQDTASFANQEVARRIQADPAAMIDWLIYDSHQNPPKAISSEFLNNRARLRFDDVVAMIGAAQTGLGIVRMPMFLGRTSEGLVQVPVLPPQPYADVWVVGHPDVWPSQKLRAFRTILTKHCREPSHRFVE